MPRIERPGNDEYDAFYEGYVREVGDADVLDVLTRQGEETSALLASIDEESALYRYAEGKWSVKQIAGHLADAERVFAYRAMSFARGETQALPGFDENDYVAAVAFDARSLDSLAAELSHLRGATVSLFAGLTGEELARRGVANGVGFSVRALAFIIAGHERHHLDVLGERYLPAIEARS